MPTETLFNRGDEITTHLTDKGAAEVLSRLSADHRSKSFASSLVSDLARYGSLFPNKRFWLHALALEQIENEFPTEQTGGGRLPNIAGFLTPVSAKLKSGARVAFTAGDITVTIRRATERSRWPGSFYITRNGEYAGRIAPDGQFLPTPACGPDVLALLDEFETDPRGYATYYGVRNGKCFACDAILDDPISVGIGCGPVCSKHYSIPWGKRALEAALKARQAMAVQS